MQKILFIFFVMVASRAYTQLYPQQSMYMFNALGINPGAVGQQNALNVTLSHRTMWRGIDGAPKTEYLSVHSPLKNEKIAVGMQVTRDAIGVSARTSILASAAYRIRLADGKLAFGLSLGMTSAVNQWSQLTTTESNDFVFNTGDMSYWLPSAGAGIYYESTLNFAGISIPQFFTETYAGGNEYRAVSDFDNNSYHLMGGRRFILSESLQIQGSALMKYHEGTPLQMDLSCIARYKKLVDLGFTVRPKDAVSVIGRAKVNDQLRVAYSYDYITSQLSRYNKGTHEIALIYTFIYNSNAPNTRFF